MSNTYITMRYSAEQIDYWNYCYNMSIIYGCEAKGREDCFRLDDCPVHGRGTVYEEMENKNKRHYLENNGHPQPLNQYIVLWYIGPIELTSANWLMSELLILEDAKKYFLEIPEKLKLICLKEQIDFWIKNPEFFMVE